MAERLKLRARDAVDMDVMAALLQDAIVPLSEMDYLPRERRFALVLNRFMWERTGRASQAEASRTESEDGRFEDGDARFEDGAAADSSRFWRTHSGLIFDRVKAVATRNLPRGRKSTLLNLLTVASQPKRITFHFSGGAFLRLEVAEIRCHLEDLGDPWPASDLPRHLVEADATP
ncbi:DUF2948 family protein [Algihabitans albus]|uniref:DUF2948 family protein n=1 Tax=Algihabitans albus TaxID=2164067 RepID=UPI000E5CFCE9|nr:DUF2948 family protein [Algihabitans albus]